MTDQAREWIDRRAIAFALGELDEAEEVRFRELAADDAEFGELLEPGPEAGHVPAALIARWADAGRHLSDLEHSLVEAHLGWCPSCQEELRLVAHDSVRGVVGASRSGWKPWFGGAVLGMAAMAVFVMLSAPQAPLRQGEYLEVVSPRAVRGAGATTVQLPADAQAFLLAVALPTDVEDGAAAALVLTAPDGRRLLETPVGIAPWERPSTQVLVLADPRFEAGEYAVRLIVGGEDQERDLGSFVIELR